MVSPFSIAGLPEFGAFLPALLTAICAFIIDVVRYCDLKLEHSLIRAMTECRFPLIAVLLIPELATRSAWGYRLYTRPNYIDVMGMHRVAPSLTRIHHVRGKAPITFGTLLEGNKSITLAPDFSIDKSISARVAYRNYLGNGSDADRYSDRDFVAFSMTMKF